MYEQNGWIHDTFVDVKGKTHSVVMKVVEEGKSFLFKSEHSGGEYTTQMNENVRNRERNGTGSCNCRGWILHKERACWHLQYLFNGDFLDVSRKIGVITERLNNGKDVMAIVKPATIHALYKKLER